MIDLKYSLFILSRQSQLADLRLLREENDLDVAGWNISPLRTET